MAAAFECFAKDRIIAAIRIQSAAKTIIEIKTWWNPKKSQLQERFSASCVKYSPSAAEQAAKLPALIRTKIAPNAIRTKRIGQTTAKMMSGGVSPGFSSAKYQTSSLPPDTAAPSPAVAAVMIAIRTVIRVAGRGCVMDEAYQSPFPSSPEMCYNLCSNIGAI